MGLHGSKTLAHMRNDARVQPLASPHAHDFACLPSNVALQVLDAVKHLGQLVPLLGSSCAQRGDGARERSVVLAAFLRREARARSRANSRPVLHLQARRGLRRHWRGSGHGVTGCSML